MDKEYDKNQKTQKKSLKKLNQEIQKIVSPNLNMKDTKLILQ